ncbi:MAG: ABC transporter ATP-binding protein [Gallicola sp.]|nr:ABC transporter ATP-binding protein [Gallicola sp.]
MKEIIIKTDKLCKTYSSGGVQQHVLKNLDLEIYEGDFTVIMGSSGAGKSTLLYAVSGMDKPTLGKIYFSEKEINNMNNDQLAVFRRSHCGFVFQQIYLMDTMSVLDNVLAAGYLSSTNKEVLIERAEDLFQSVNIEENLYDKFPSQLSGGEAQRCGLVRALINNPEVVFADEPTGQLNSGNSLAVLDLFTELHEKGQSIVMVTHDLKTASRGNRIIYLKDGLVCGELDLGKYSADDSSRYEKLNHFLSEMGW